MTSVNDCVLPLTNFINKKNWIGKDPSTQGCNLVEVGGCHVIQNTQQNVFVFCILYTNTKLKEVPSTQGCNLGDVAGLSYHIKNAFGQKFETADNWENGNYVISLSKYV